METQPICPSCQKTLPPGMPLGLCPECLIKSGFKTGGDPASAAADKPRFVPPPVEELARLFPHLEIIAFIGQGGMGAVYKARQPALDRFVALKILPPGSAGDPGFAERFNREARALARLSHPHIVGVHDFGFIRSRRREETDQTDTGTKAPPSHIGGYDVEENGIHYLVMEFVDGANLRQVEQAGRLAPEQALEIVPQICEALQFAHNEGIVHRDIKPENILIDKRGRVKITDFGIAKILGVSSGKAALTGAKDIVGTPHYMAPEQVEKPSTVDHRADIYSLGVVFYEMLTGELPLGKFAPPSRKVQVDVRLDDVVLRTLEKEPELRYQQASEVKARVETIATTPRNAEQARDSSAEIPPVTPALEATIKKLVEARHQVRWPATGLLVTALLSPVLPGLMVVAGRLKIGAWSLWPFIFVLAATSIAAFGALRMRRLESYRSALAGSIAGCLLSFFNLLCLPFAVWSLAVLSRRNVREAFGQAHLLPPEPAPPIRGGMWKFAMAAAAVFVVAAGVVLITVLGLLMVRRSSPSSSPMVNVQNAAGRSQYPKAEHISADLLSALIYHDNFDLHYALFHADNFRSFIKNSNMGGKSWLDSGNVRLFNERDFSYRRESSRPEHLQLNGRAFDLRAGRIFVLRDDGTVEQKFLFPPLEVARDPAALSRLIHQRDQEDEAAHTTAMQAVEDAVSYAQQSNVGSTLQGKLPETVVDLGGGIKMEFVLIPPGQFVMGGDFADEAPAHRVFISKWFHLGKFEVTQEQWDAVMDSDPSYLKGPKLPVDNVSWDEAQNFLRKLQEKTGQKFGLPTEAQWEYGCRAGSTTLYSFGDSEADLADYAWFAGNSAGVTHPVGEKKPNPWGLYDMHGNVSEWCADKYNQYNPYPFRRATTTDPIGLSSGDCHVIRGGGFSSEANGLRSSNRSSDYRGISRTGLRCVLLTETKVKEVAEAKPAKAISPSLAAPQESFATTADESEGKSLDLGGGIKMEFVLIRPGSFIMGTDMGSSTNYVDEKPAHKVTLTRPFYLGKFEITQEQWHAVMDNDPGAFKDSKLPMDNVSWDDAQVFLSKLREKTARIFTLPTEAQWEYACRAGTSTRYSFGDTEANLAEYGWFADNSEGRTHPVGEKKPNPWGLHDMHGNVWEWCADGYEKYSALDVNDPRSPIAGNLRVIRGGAWNSEAGGLRSSNRNTDWRGYHHVGLRVVSCCLTEK